MKFTTAAAATAALAATATLAAPTKRAVTDTDILQYALTLEHLENAFYHEALAKFSQEDFMGDGFPDWVRNRIEQIASHEADHVSLLSGAIGDAATKPCEYSFGLTTPEAFAALASVIENVGVSAYLGAAQYITEPAYVTVAGSILTTEARHQGWIESSVKHNAGWSGAYDTPLLFSEVYSIAAGFITSCPSTNPTLPVKAFPTLTVAEDGTVTSTADVMTGNLILYSGLQTGSYPIVNGKAQGVPTTMGYAYALVSSEADATKVSDDNVIAGPFVRSNPFTSKVENPVITL